MKNKKYITASEIGNYIFCKRCWWLELLGLKKRIVTDAMIQGTTRHMELSNELEQLDKQQFLSKYLLFGVIAVFVILVILKLLHIV